MKKDNENNIVNLSAKVVLLGDPMVGKTTLRKRYMGITTDRNYIPTIGADISINVFEKEKLTDQDESFRVKLFIWDLSGQQTFATVRPLYYKDTSAIMLVYDISNEQSFRNIENWLKESSKYIPLMKTPLILVANKIDLKSQIERYVASERAKELIERLNTEANLEYHLPLIETSAITGENVKEAFAKLGEMYIDLYLKER